MSIPKGAALGSTEDPKALIVGEPSSLDTAALDLETQATTVKGVGTDLGGVKTPSWTGPASMGFWGFFAGEPGSWEDIAQVMTLSAGALRDQAGALRTAQDKAQDAIEKWKAAQQATDQAVTQHNEAVKAHNTKVEAGELSLPPGPFHDPGESMREEAQQILDDAATALDEAGLDNAGKIAGWAGVSWNDSEGSASGPGTDSEAASDPEYKSSDPNHFYGDDKPWKNKPGEEDKGFTPEVTLGTASASAYLGQLQGSTEGNYHGIDYSAEGEITVGAEAEASWGVTDTGVKGSASASVGVQASGEASAEYGYLGVNAEGTAMAGAEAGAEGSVGTDGVHASGEAFAGAQIEGSVGADVGGVGAAVTGEAWAGAGVSASADVGYEDGEITIGGHFGAGLGIGGQVGGEITIDVEEVTETVGDLADGVGDFAGDVGDGLGDAAGAVGGFLGL